MRSIPRVAVLGVLLIGTGVAGWQARVDAQAGKYFRITVVDEATGRGVPLVELKTVNNVLYYTDSNGIVAFHEPGLMDRRVFFHVKSHGYEYPKDGFGYRGKALAVKAGGSAVLKIKRLNIAERLYRQTGGGIYRDSLLVGAPVPTKAPALNGQVLGQDSVVNAVYGGKIHWFWGDTNRPGYPLGNFHVPGATSELPAKGGLNPDVGVNLAYFLKEDGFAKETARLPGRGPTWINGLTVLRDPDGRERMFAHYVKIKPPLTTYERGIVEFRDEKQIFEQVVEFALAAPGHPHGHSFEHTIDGRNYVYFTAPYPHTRVPANPRSFLRQESYETYTCLKAGSRREELRLDRDADGKLVYAWKKNAPLLTARDQDRLIKSGRMKPEEALFRMTDAATGQRVIAHRGSVYWNAYRQRWVMIFCETGGASMLGEIWYSEAEKPLGPWTKARKIVTHDRYSFYNPKQHPMFDQEGGRTIYFEGTYTHTFSGNPDQTPRYDYNQIMYRLDLTDERLRLE